MVGVLAVAGALEDCLYHESALRVTNSMQTHSLLKHSSYHSDLCLLEQEILDLRQQTLGGTKPTRTNRK